jgi:hypothetical protein
MGFVAGQGSTSPTNHIGRSGGVSLPRASSSTGASLKVYHLFEVSGRHLFRFSRAYEGFMLLSSRGIEVVVAVALSVTEARYLAGQLIQQLRWAQWHRKYR